MQIQPSSTVLQSWLKTYVPEKDLFFLTEDQIKRIMDFSAVLIMPIKEFYAHSSYSQIAYTNSYEYWNIKAAKYVIIAASEWIEQLPKEDQHFILTAQIECERGLVIPISFIQDTEQVPQSYVINDHVVLQRNMWEKLSVSCKEQLLLATVYEWWDNGQCEEIPSFLPSFLLPYANKFGVNQGANCLAAVLYAVCEGKQPWFISEWIHQQTFIEKLAQYHYHLTQSNTFQPKDVAVWTDENGIIQHAAYHIEENIFFNKHGQTIFNPWKLLSKEHLDKEWAHLTCGIYRHCD